MRQHIFLKGLFITLRRLPAVLWTYAFSLGLAFLFSIPLHSKISTLLSHSLAAQRLTGAFDLGTAAEIFTDLHAGPVGDAGSSFGHGSIFLFLAIYFLLVPGTLFVYLTSTSARLSTLLHQGLLHFWRFVRITLIAAIVCGLILGPLSFFQARWADHVDDQWVGRNAFLLTITGDIIVFLIASILRLYFDLVEVYTVQLGLHLRHSIIGQPKPDRRVRRTLIPAWRTLRANFSQVWPIFLFLAILGATAVILTARTSMHMLAQPRVWPTFLLMQLGLFLMLFTRFWQRGVETALALENPIIDTTLPPLLPIAARVNPLDPLHPSHTQPLAPRPIHEPISDPEPAPPSLDEPDPGVFGHEPTKPPQ